MQSSQAGFSLLGCNEVVDFPIRSQLLRVTTRHKQYPSSSAMNSDFTELRRNCGQVNTSPRLVPVGGVLERYPRTYLDTRPWLGSCQDMHCSGK